MKSILVFLTIFLFLSCGPEPQKKHLTYQNIVILSDLSSRLENKPNKDLQEINEIITYFKNECVKPGEKIGDKSSIYFSSFSEKNIASIDFNNFKSITYKQQFVNSTGKYQNSGLEHQLKSFEEKVKGAYSNIRNNGLDLISILIEKIENEPIIKKNTYLTDGLDTTFINYENHIYILTDGYLEYMDKSTNDQFYFGISEIKKIRDLCVLNNENVTSVIEKNPALCLPPSKNNKNKFISLHILETHERDKNDKFQTYKYPIGVRDNEILEAVWRKWAKESGFKELLWDKY